MKPRQFLPDWTVCPGATIKEILEIKKLSIPAFAREIGKSVDFVNRLLVGEEKITNALAVKFEKILGGTTSFWKNREANYRADLIRLGKKK